MTLCGVDLIFVNKKYITKFYTAIKIFDSIST